MGEPVKVSKGLEERLLVDGGGLCSKGLWLPEKRGAVSALGEKIRQQMQLAVLEHSDGFESIMKILTRGNLKEDPFPQEVVKSAKVGIENLVKEDLKNWIPRGQPLSQNIDVESVVCVNATLRRPGLGGNARL